MQPRECWWGSSLELCNSHFPCCTNTCMWHFGVQQMSPWKKTRSIVPKSIMVLKWGKQLLRDRPRRLFSRKVRKESHLFTCVQINAHLKSGFFLHKLFSVISFTPIQWEIQKLDQPSMWTWFQFIKFLHFHWNVLCSEVFCDFCPLTDRGQGNASCTAPSVLPPKFVYSSRQKRIFTVK